MLLCLFPWAERDGQPPPERRRVHGGRAAAADGTLHVRPAGHGHPDRGEGGCFNVSRITQRLLPLTLN